MAVRSPSTGPVRQQAKQATRKVVANPWFERLARFGYASKGVVYLLAGLFTARAAFGLGGGTVDKNGVLLKILAERFPKWERGMVHHGGTETQRDRGGARITFGGKRGRTRASRHRRLARVNESFRVGTKFESAPGKRAFGLPGRI